MNTKDLKSQEAGSPVTKADGPSGSKLHPGPATSSDTVVEVRLLPAERMALTVALAQVTEGRELLPNVGAMCVLALARITGRYDYTANPTDEKDLAP